MPRLMARATSSSAHVQVDMRSSRRPCHHARCCVLKPNILVCVVVPAKLMSLTASTHAWLHMGVATADKTHQFLSVAQQPTRTLYHEIHHTDPGRLRNSNRLPESWGLMDELGATQGKQATW